MTDDDYRPHIGTRPALTDPVAGRRATSREAGWLRFPKQEMQGLHGDEGNRAVAMSSTSLCPAELFKVRPRVVDPVTMAAPPEPGSLDSPTAWTLRAKYRCQMCHKRCWVPCRFTSSEFRQLEQAVREGRFPDDGSKRDVSDV